MLGCLTPPRRELLCDKPDLFAELAILLLQSGNDLVAVDDTFEFGLVLGRPLQYLFDSRAVFALQFADKVEALFDFAQAARIVFDIAFVATDARGHIFQAIDGFREIIGVLFQILVKTRKLIQTALCYTQLVEGRFEIISTYVGSFDSSIDQETEFAQPLCIAQNFTFLFQFLDLSGLKFSLLDLFDLITQEFGATSLVAFVFLHLLQGFASVAPLGDFGGELRA